MIPGMALLLAAFAAAAYGPALSLPFMGDDYVFLDKTRSATFMDLWSFNNVNFEWYRPWSRELHFWVLQRVAGLHEVAYHTFSVVLWTVALCLYAAIVLRLASPRVAMLATLGVASLALWGTPVLWISGSQDLWMLCFAMTSMLLFIAGHIWWALLPFGLALLSKETSAVLPALICSYQVFVERRHPMVALRRTAHLWALALGWFLIHPTLHLRLFSGAYATRELEQRPSLEAILARTVLSVVNLDALPHPQEVRWGDVVRTLAAAAILAAGALFATRAFATRDPLETRRSERKALTRFAVAWTAVGWLPLFLPSIAWHAYYGCLGVLGAWFGLALWLQDHRRVAVASIACLALLRGAQANTLSWDWGTEWYQRRAGNILAAIRDDLHRRYPTLPLYSRVFFGHVPNNIGLISGQSPALRVWYRDSTLQADFYSNYHPRPIAAPRGQDFFFRFDSVAGMVEVKVGLEDARLGISSNPSWERDHEALAMVLLRSGDVVPAALEFEKLSQLPRRGDAAGLAGVCWEVVGDTARADTLLGAAGTRMHLSDPELRDWVARLKATFPGGRRR
jgi:hypothetical protein